MPLVFRQRMSKGLRWFLAGAGIFCFYPTYDLLIRPGVPVLQLGMAPMWAITLGAMALGLVLLAAALFGPRRTLVFDPAAREVRELGAADFGLRWRRRYAFRDLGSPAVRREEDSDGPAYYRVVIPCTSRKQPIDVERYDDEASARKIVEQIAAVMAPQHDA